MERVRHRTFMLLRFGLFFAALAIWVLSLSAGRLPHGWEALAVAWFTVPLLAATAVARTGCLERAEAASALAWIGLAFTAAAGRDTSLLGVAVLVLMAPIEASVSNRAGLVVKAAVAAACAMALLGLAAGTGLISAAAGDSFAAGDMFLVAPALLYHLALAWSALQLQQRGRRLAASDANEYRALAEATGDLVLRCDPSGGVAMTSREGDVLFGLPPREFLGRSFLERVHVTDRPVFLKLCADAAQGEAVISAQVRFRMEARDADAERAPLRMPTFAWIELRARGTGAGPARSILAIVRDVTGEVERRHTAETARGEAERAGAWRDSLLANVSHELRTPLNAIIGFSEMLSSPDLAPADPDKQRDYARIITSSGQHLLSVVNSLLDASRIEAGCFPIEPEPFAFAPMVESCVDMVGLKAEQSGVTIRTTVTPAVGEIVADKRACRQIVINLLSNALKFTPAGGTVSVCAKLEGGAVLLSIADTGIGIASRDLSQLGDAFFQAGAGLDRSYEGTGLGLSVVRGLVGLHGGAIRVASAPGEGTEVTVRLPLDCRTAAGRARTTKIETIAQHSRPTTPARRPVPARMPQVA